MRLKTLCALVVLNGVAAMAAVGGARAGDLGDDTHDWSGLYAGLAVNGTGSGVDIRGVGDKEDVSVGSVSLTGLAGYNFSSGPFVLGLEGEFGVLGTDKRMAVAGLGTVRAEADWNAAVALRAGWAIDDLLLFAKVGVAFTDMDLSSSLGGRKNATLTGGMAGLGAEYAVTDMWSLRAEADVYGFSDEATLGGAERNFDLGQGVLRLGVSMKF